MRVVIPRCFMILYAIGCNEAYMAANKLYEEDHHVDALFGLVCSFGAEPVAHFARAWNIPLVSYFASSAIFENKITFPTMARVSPSQYQFAEATLQFLLQNNWNRFAMVWWNTGTTVVYTMAIKRKLLEEMGTIELAAEYVVDAGFSATNRTFYDSIMPKLREKARVILVVLYDLVTARQFMLAAHAANMTGPSYVYLFVNIVPDNEADYPWLNGEEKERETIGRLMQNSLVLMTSMQSWATLNPAINQYLHSVQPPLQIESVARPSWLPRIRDAWQLFAQALNTCMHAEPDCNWRNGRQLAEHFRNVSFEGASGMVQLNQNADRVNDIIAMALDPSVNQLTTRFLVTQTTNGKFMMIKKQAFNWRTDDGNPPPDTPHCGFNGALCPEEDKSGVYMVLGIICVVLISTLVIGSTLEYRRRSFEKSLSMMAWFIDENEIVIQTNVNHLSLSSMNEGHRSMVDGSRTRALVAKSVTGSKMEDDINAETAGCSLDTDQRRTYYGMHHGVRVSVRRCDCSVPPRLNQRPELLLLKTVKEMQHDNVNSFVGLFVSQQRSAMYFTWSCTQKGSLQDVLYNPEINLDMSFKASMMKDIILGLEFIHRTALTSHGLLIASSCLIDSRWVVKLSDYGIDELMRMFRMGGSDVSRKFTPSHLLGLAPEYLRSMDDFGFGVAPTQAGDVYSFGMILYQIIFREKPFESNQLVTEEEIVEQILVASDVVVRPVVQSDDVTEPQLLLLIRQCWSEQPDHRPRLSRVKDVVFTSTSRYASNVVEHMAEKLERYADDLERMVEARTRDLAEERRRAELLLERMLPRSIADKLKMGVLVEPELFESVTVFISDVVKFTDICAASTPVQVVQMMNGLFSLLDSHIDACDAYKVETIGDACVVVSGLPIRNGSEHVTVIAKLALDVRDALYDYEVAHLASRRLLMRIGIHTGAVAAGVVGLHMPHYCLFGDTVNFAETMESSGRPMKVHISKKTKFLAEGTPQNLFRFESRGLVDIKNRGSIETFWLERAV